MNDFKILQKVYDMILYGNQCLKQFPKAEKYAMAADIRQSMYRLLRLVIEANKKYHKKTTAQQMDVELEILRTFIRLAADKNLKYLPLNKYENWAKMLNEIGRMLGGWIKSMN
ncbi:diversity-generating retroelement protein Avd [Jeotgalibaca porci]|uniref:diversity-generating retroelement protein Avd n=1 Tax=Jeotgalibaca porci TaxID=1868793 RepID=UPI0035A04A9F